MWKEKLIPMTIGVVLHMPLVKTLLSYRTGGTIEGKYCYSVWLRHLKMLNSVQNGIPKRVAELGPGDSLGIGFAALLSGCESFRAFDVIKYWNVERNLNIFEELVVLFKNKAPIPDNTEYPKVQPRLDDYAFPDNILSDEILKDALAESRLEAIREEIKNPDNPGNTFVKFFVPWDDYKVINPDSIDFVYSQAVLEHVEDLEGTYFAFSKWLKKGGIMSHSIDFKCHRTTKSWNGHRTYSELEWKIVKGGRKFLINRMPYSAHQELQKKHGFSILKDLPAIMANDIPRSKFSRRFRNLSEEDMTTSEAYMLSVKE
ncbi:MAG: methyltransferase domain-containing protein [Mucilaginibacter sp.]|uniref:methyltransferase domain-containing protein n=1 Tax=Mucilaginibacter sp. TaxID=1882438 RepID=UPI0031B066E5